MINVLAADRLMTSPKVYSTFCVDAQRAIRESARGRGSDKPTIVLLRRRSALLFTDAPAALTARSSRCTADPLEGVGIYFVKQNPLDLRRGSRTARQPGAARFARVLPTRSESRQSRRANHADEPGVRRGARDYRACGGRGAVVSLLDGEGSPTVVERAWIVPTVPRSVRSLRPSAWRLTSVRCCTGHYEKAVDFDVGIREN